MYKALYASCYSIKKIIYVRTGAVYLLDRFSLLHKASLSIQWKLTYTVYPATFDIK